MSPTKIMPSNLGDGPFPILEKLKEEHLPTDFIGTIALMEDLNAALPDIGLAHATPFGQTYLRMTQETSAATQNGHFQDVATMERLVSNFAGYYFRAVRQHVSPTEELAIPAWSCLLDESKSASLAPWVRVSLGANAHISHDLALSARDAGLAAEHRDDFFAINRIIKNLMPILMNDYFSFGQPLIVRGANNSFYQLIKSWRRSAWEMHGQLITAETPWQEGLARSILLQRSTRNAKLLQCGGKVLQLAGIAGANT